MVELVLGREFRVDRAPPLQELRQPVIGLRPDHEIDDRRAPADLLAPARHAARDRDREVAEPCLGPLGLEFPDAAELGIDLLRRLLADVAGVEDDEIGVGHLGRLGIALRRQRIGHARRVIGVHLAAVGLDEDTPLRRGVRHIEGCFRHPGAISRKRRPLQTENSLPIPDDFCHRPASRPAPLEATAPAAFSAAVSF